MNKSNIETNKPDVDFLSWLILTGNTTYKLVDAVVKHFKIDELALSNGFKLHRDKIGTLVVDYKEDGYADSMGLNLFLAVSKLKERSDKND